MDEIVKKQTEEGLAEIYRNAQLAITSISDVMPSLEEGDETLREELIAQHEAYEQFSARAQMLARDLEILQARGYKLVKACAVDMFPQTYHCETIALLILNI